jgi:hypothetical protein
MSEEYHSWIVSTLTDARFFDLAFFFFFLPLFVPFPESSSPFSVVTPSFLCGHPCNEALNATIARPVSSRPAGAGWPESTALKALYSSERSFVGAGGRSPSDLSIGNAGIRSGSESAGVERLVYKNSRTYRSFAFRRITLVRLTAEVRGTEREWMAE